MRFGFQIPSHFIIQLQGFCEQTKNMTSFTNRTQGGKTFFLDTNILSFHRFHHIFLMSQQAPPSLKFQEISLLAKAQMYIRRKKKRSEKVDEESRSHRTNCDCFISWHIVQIRAIHFSASWVVLQSFFNLPHICITVGGK